MLSSITSLHLMYLYLGSRLVGLYLASVLSLFVSHFTFSSLTCFYFVSVSVLLNAMRKN